jgi:hypothetical protein
VHYRNILKEFFFIEYYKSKYIAQVIYNQIFPLPKQKAITKMMNHNHQILSSKTLCFYKLMFYFIFVEMEFEP